jgi:hypothetical protein
VCCFVEIVVLPLPSPPPLPKKKKIAVEAHAVAIASKCTSRIRTALRLDLYRRERRPADEQLYLSPLDRGRLQHGRAFEHIWLEISASSTSASFQKRTTELIKRL